MLLLGLGATAWAANEYEVDEKFTTIDALDGQRFAIVDETPDTPTGMGIGVSGHGSGWDMYFGTITEAYNSNACYYQLEAVQTEGLEGYYYLRTYKNDGTMYTAWGNTTNMGYFNSQTADKTVCFALGLNGQNGQDGENLAVWAIEVSEGKFALKNIGTGLYLHGDNLPAKYEDPFYFTFCTLKAGAEIPDPVIEEPAAPLAENELIPDFFSICADGAIPYGYDVKFGSENRAYPNTYGSGARMFAFAEGGDFTRGLYFREGYVLYGNVKKLALDAGVTYTVSFNSAMWKASGAQCTFQIFEEGDLENAVLTQTIDNAPDVNGSKDAVTGSTFSEIEFTPAAKGNYILKWSVGGFNEVLLANVAVKAPAPVMIETDLTSQFNSLATTKWTGSSGQVGWAAPKVTTNSGLNVAAWERYDGNCTGTGEIMSSTVTGLSAGTYKIELYGAAAFTFGRGFGSEAFTGDLSVDTSQTYSENQSITDETGVVLYAITSEGTYSEEIPIWYATNFNTSGISTVVLDGVVVGSDGEIKIGMSKTSQSTNWHVVQLKGVTATVNAIPLFAKALIDAKAYQTVDMADDAKTALNTTISTYENATLTTADEYEAAITALNAAIKAAKAAADAYRIAQYYIDLADGAYYIIDATSGKMMAAGHNYGTRGIVKEFGLDLTLTTNAEAHTVTFDSQVSNGGDSHFLGSNLYMDAAAFGWYLDKQDNGFFYITNDAQYISIDADDNLVMSDEPYAWAIVSADAVIAAGIEEFANATAEAPVDATFLIKGANFNRNDARNAGWSTWSETADQGTNLTISGGNEVNNCAESYHAQFYVQQTIQGVPNGIYRLTAQGFYRQDGEDTENLPVFFANGETATFPERTGTEGSMTAASESFANGAYTIEPIEFVVEDGTITLGAKLEGNTDLWCIFDNFQLVYAGPVPPAFPEEGAVGYLFNVHSKLLVNANGNLVGRTLADKDADLFTVWRKSSDKTDGSEVRLAAGKTGDKWNALRFNDKGLVVCESEDYSKWKLEKDGSYWLLKHNYDSSNGGADATGNVGKGYLTVNPETRMFEVTAESTDYSLWQFITWEEYESLTTTIGSVSEKAAQKGIFNVAGQQMKALQKGLNIVDGKKIYVK